MTVITVSTVGFTEVRSLSNAGRLFTSFYIILNLSIIAYFVSVITTYFFEGELKKIYKGYISGMQVKKLKGHTIVCGYGRTGARTCEELMKSKQDFVVIENNREAVERLNQSDIQFIEGNATLDDTLKQAGIEKAKSIITTLPSDSDNVYITLTAKELSPDIYIISRATEDSSEKKLLRAGASKVVMPDALGGKYMAQLLTKPDVIEFLEMLSGMKNISLNLEEFHYSGQKRTISQLDIRNKTGATIIGIKDKNDSFTFNPDGDTIIEKGDVLIIIGSYNSLKEFRSIFNKG